MTCSLCSWQVKLCLVSGARQFGFQPTHFRPLLARFGLGGEALDLVPVDHVAGTDPVERVGGFRDQWTAVWRQLWGMRDRFRPSL
jgi:hypothetical protein